MILLKSSLSGWSIDHILLLGHKSAFYSREGKFVRDFDGAESIVQSQTEQLWPEMQKNKVAAMLSALVHTYDRFQPQGNGSYQVIAGNAGSLADENKTGDCGKAPDFLGYSHVCVIKSGKLIHVSLGWKIDACNYLQPVPNNIKTCTYDSLEIQWGTNNGS